jgi:Arc/MetJ-type ribon-helix-helix transcriptional regulator
MDDTQVTLIQTKVPSGLLSQAGRLVEAGWHKTLDEVISDALRRYLESHREELMENFVHQDVEWGLRGDE